MTANETFVKHPRAAAAPPLDFDLLSRQVLGILRLELRRNLFSKRAFALYFLAFFPVFLVGVWTLTPFPTTHIDGPSEAMTMFAMLFVPYLRISIFLSTLFLFMSLFRSEIQERSLHYYFLTPVRREILVVGKYLSALFAGCGTYLVSTAALYVLTCLPWGVREASRYLFQGPGLGNLAAYLGIAVLACAGYGAVFLLAGLFFRNPVIPAFLVFCWEFINFLLPAFLKKVSVIFYLQALYPIPTEVKSLLAVIADPPRVWVSIFGLLIFTVLVLGAACWRARAMEVAYGGE
ncbi:MAG: ABC transporter permease [bacterium]|nr:ABC transporter permease [bacterium]